MSTLKIKEMFEIGALRDYGDHYISSNKSVVVFVSDPSRPGVKDIAADFGWRREHNAPMDPKEVRTIVEPYLNTEGMVVKGVSYSRNAGCSMCPCSPGYIFTLVNSYSGRKKSLWVTPNTIYYEKNSRQETRDYESEVAGMFGTSREAVL